MKMINNEEMCVTAPLTREEFRQCHDDRLQRQLPMVLALVVVLFAYDTVVHGILFEHKRQFIHILINVLFLPLLAYLALRIHRAEPPLPNIRYIFAVVVFALMSQNWIEIFCINDPSQGYGGFWITLVFTGFMSPSLVSYLVLTSIGLTVTLSALHYFPSEDPAETILVYISTWMLAIILIPFSKRSLEQRDQLRAHEVSLKKYLEQTIDRLRREQRDREESESSLKIREIQLRESRDAMAQMARRMSVAEILAAIAHEVNQPLHAIVNYTRACEILFTDEEPNWEKIRIWNSKLSKEAARAGRIIRQFRLFAKRTEPNVEPVVLGPIINEALSISEGLLSATAVETYVDEGGFELLMRVDRILVVQVFSNLIRNACDAMADVEEARRSLTVSATQDKAWARICFEDRGGGIGLGEGANLFEPFVSNGGVGLGLGLTVCRSIVEAHGGRIWAEPAKPCGSRFLMTLPLLDESEEIPGED